MSLNVRYSRVTFSQLVMTCVPKKVEEDEIINEAYITFMQTTYPFVHEIELNFNSLMKVLAPSRKSPEHFTRR